MKRAYKVAKECKIDFKNFYIIGGYRFPENLEAEVKKEQTWNTLEKLLMTEKLKIMFSLENLYLKYLLHPQRIIQ